MKLKIKKLFFTMFLCFLFIPTIQSVSAMANNNNNNNNNGYNILIIGGVQLKNEYLARNIGAYLQSAIKNKDSVNGKIINKLDTLERFPFEKCIATLLARRTTNWPLEDEFIEEQIGVNCKKFTYMINYTYNNKNYNINVNIYIVSPMDLNAINEIDFLQAVDIRGVAICLQNEDLELVNRYVDYVRANVRNKFDDLRLIVPVGITIYCDFRRKIRSLEHLEFNTRIMNIDIDVTKEMLGEGVLECEYDLNGITGYIREIFIKLSDVFNMVNGNA